MAAKASEDISSVKPPCQPSKTGLSHNQPNPIHPIQYCTKTPVECFLHIPFSPPNDQPISILISISISISISASACTCVRILSSYSFYKLFVRIFGLNLIVLCRCCARTFVCSLYLLSPTVRRFRKALSSRQIGPVSPWHRIIEGPRRGLRSSPHQNTTVPSTTSFPTLLSLSSPQINLCSHSHRINTDRWCRTQSTTEAGLPLCGSDTSCPTAAQ